MENCCGELVEDLCETTPSPDASTSTSADAGMDSPIVRIGKAFLPVPMMKILTPMSVFANYLTDQDLRICKLVCKKWAEEARIALEKRSWLRVLKGSYAEADALMKRKQRGEKVIISYMQLVGLHMNDPYFSQLILAFGDMMNDFAMKRCKVNFRILMFILAQKLPNIETLRLENVYFVSGAELPDSLFPYIDTTLQEPPVLKRIIRLSFPTDLDSKVEDIHVPVKMEDILKMCPNLKKLDSTRLPLVRPTSFANHTWKTLESLQIFWMETLDVVVLSKVIHKMGCMRKLRLEGLESSNSKVVAGLKGVLKAVAGTLEELLLAERLEQSKPLTLLKSALKSHLPVEKQKETVVRSSPLPMKLAKLKLLEVTQAFFTTFDALGLLPRLETLTIQASAGAYWETMLVQSNLNKRYRTVNLFLRCITPEALFQLSPLFPNAKNLSLIDSKIDDKMMRALFSGFPSIDIFGTSVLDTRGCELTDSGITGIPSVKCNRILKKKNWQKVDIESLRTDPFIGNLKVLTSFNLDDGLVDNLTDVSVLFGFIHLSKLLCLDLSNSKITDVSLEAIGTHMPYLKLLAVPGCSGITEVGIQRLKQRLENLEVILDADCTSEEDLTDLESSEYGDEEDSESDDDDFQQLKKEWGFVTPDKELTNYAEQIKL